MPSKYTATWTPERLASPPTHPAYLVKCGGALPGTNLCGSEPTSTEEHMWAVTFFVIVETKQERRSCLRIFLRIYSYNWNNNKRTNWVLKHAEQPNVAEMCEKTIKKRGFLLITFFMSPVRLWQQGSGYKCCHCSDDLHPPALQGGVSDHHLPLQELCGLQGREEWQL